MSRHAVNELTDLSVNYVKLYSKCDHINISRFRYANRHVFRYVEYIL